MGIVTRWEAKDGTLFKTEWEAMKHDAGGDKPFRCPQCNGLGHYSGGKPITEYGYDEEATAFGGMFAHPVYNWKVVGYEQVTCGVCDGQGWTARQLKPITKVVGWEK